MRLDLPGLSRGESSLVLIFNPFLFALLCDKREETSPRRGSESGANFLFALVPAALIFAFPELVICQVK